MSDIIIHPEAIEAAKNARLPDGDLGFGHTPAPVMYHAHFDGARWSRRELLPMQEISFHPFAKNLHYAQQVFEGLKAYRTQQDAVHFFRPQENAKRLNVSGDRMCMQPVPEEIFMEGIHHTTQYSQQVIPKDPGTSLYLRPFSMGIDPKLGMAASRAYDFYVVASPSQGYHSGSMEVLIQRDACRAAICGTGAAKTAGNYAASIQANKLSQDAGYDQSLWLDPQQRHLIEELSGMNMFAVINGELHTPELTDSFLDGITRNSIIKLAHHLDYKVVEKSMPINELLADITANNCSEVFACGTATVVSAISLIADSDNKQYKLSDTRISQRLRHELLDIQEGRAADPFNWIVPLNL